MNLAPETERTLLAAVAGAATFAVVTRLLDGLGRPASLGAGDTKGLWDWGSAKTWFAVRVTDPLRKVSWWYQGTAKKLTDSEARLWRSQAVANNWEYQTVLYRHDGGAWRATI